MKRFSILLLFFALIGFSGFLVTSCQKNDAMKGTLRLSLTDSPIDAYNITGVYITITGIEYNHNEQWKVFEGFEGPKTFNLLELTQGVSALLGNFELEAGKYTQIRFMLDAPARGSGKPSNPGCWIEFADQSTVPLFVPSGGQTGYKAVGKFMVPVNGEVHVTADFDVRKSVVAAGQSGIFILKPTIRLVVDNQAGAIAGTLTNLVENTEYVVFAYEDGKYAETEAAEPDPEKPRFPNAVVSSAANGQGKFYLAFLAQGLYDLVVVAMVDGKFSKVAKVIENVEVKSKQTTNITIDLTLL